MWNPVGKVDEKSRHEETERWNNDVQERIGNIEELLSVRKSGAGWLGSGAGKSTSSGSYLLLTWKYFSSGWKYLSPVRKCICQKWEQSQTDTVRNSSCFASSTTNTVEMSIPGSLTSSWRTFVPLDFVLRALRSSWLPNQMISLILIFGFLCRSSSWRPWPHIGGCRLVWPLLRPQMTVLDQFFCKICF